MATFVLKDAYVSVNGVNLSDHCRSVSLSYEAEAVDATAMGNDTKVNVSGLKDWSVSITFAQDYAASSVDATLWPLIGGNPVTVEIRPTSAARSETNPAYSGSAVLVSYTPIDGSPGDYAETQAEFRAAGPLSRLTA